LKPRQQLAARAVAQPQPDYRRAGTPPPHPFGKIFVFGQNYRAGLDGVQPDGIVFGLGELNPTGS
jgi:hypothetical protein